MGKKIVIFADGTGNAFTGQESNVWRLYEALDKSKPDQVARYIKGVGTSAVRPFAALDGATGIGVPSNVRKLYRFLCWSWEPGDEIYMFGFSRGSFTIRTLIGLMASEGLVPTHFGDDPVSHAEMQRNARAAWRAYRKKTAPSTWWSPAIWITRAMRDMMLATAHVCHRSYRSVSEETTVQKRVHIKIAFVGLFDTVEAFGVPIEELRSAIDVAIWPISFRNRVLGPDVQCMRHALSLDDERTTFHPIRFDMANEKTERIKEVWFAGVHSDVGGGYPDGELSLIPLVWMAEEAERAGAAGGHAMRFKPGAIAGFRAEASALGPIHDSRAGTSAFYRYDPRHIAQDAASGGPPVVHYSVAERMVKGSDNYAPITLPTIAKVLMPDHSVHQIEGFSRTLRLKTAAPTPPHELQMEEAEAAVAALNAPNQHLARLTLETVWWRRVVYFVMLGAAILFALWPWLVTGALGLVSWTVGRLGFGYASDFSGDGKWSVDTVDQGLRAYLETIVRALDAVVPSYLHPWVQALAQYPIATLVVIVLVLLSWRQGVRLGDRIHDRARLAWTRPNRKGVPDGQGNCALRFAGLMRRSGPGRVYWLTANIILPLLALVAIIGLVLVTVERSWFTIATGMGAVCAAQKKTIEVGQAIVAAPAGEFATSEMCWPTGLSVAKDHKYRIWIEVTEPWFDHTIMSGVNGFRRGGVWNLLALSGRRWVTAEWFQPVLRIGSRGMTEWPLVPVDASVPDQLPRTARVNGTKVTLPSRFEETPEYLQRKDRLPGTFEPLSGDVLKAAQEVWRTQGLATLFVSEFVATETGDLFLYVNDEVQIMPFFGPHEKYYKNNSGRARVLVQRLPLPRPE